MKPRSAIVVLILALACSLWWMIGVVLGAGPTTETACCLSDGCRDGMTLKKCEKAGGIPFGLCATCEEVECPNPGCIGAIGGALRGVTAP